MPNAKDGEASRIGIYSNLPEQNGSLSFNLFLTMGKIIDSTL